MIGSYRESSIWAFSRSIWLSARRGSDSPQSAAAPTIPAGLRTGKVFGGGRLRAGRFARSRRGEGELAFWDSSEFWQSLTIIGSSTWSTRCRGNDLCVQLKARALDCNNNNLQGKTACKENDNLQ